MGFQILYHFIRRNVNQKLWTFLIFSMSQLCNQVTRDDLMVLPHGCIFFLFIDRQLIFKFYIDFSTSFEPFSIRSSALYPLSEINRSKRTYCTFTPIAPDSPLHISFLQFCLPLISLLYY